MPKEVKKYQDRVLHYSIHNDDNETKSRREGEEGERERKKILLQSYIQEGK